MPRTTLARPVSKAPEVPTFATDLTVKVLAVGIEDYQVKAADALSRVDYAR